MVKLIKYSLLFTLLLTIGCKHSNNEVLEAFDIMNEKLGENIISLQQEIDSLYRLLKDNNFKTQYDEFPAVATLTKLTQIQSDISEVKKNILIKILEK